MGEYKEYKAIKTTTTQQPKRQLHTRHLVHNTQNDSHSQNLHNNTAALYSIQTTEIYLSESFSRDVQILRILRFWDFPFTILKILVYRRF